MTQYDWGTMDPTATTGDQLAADLNNYRNSRDSLNFGSSLPSYARLGTMWVQGSTSSTAAYLVNVYDGSQSPSLFTVDQNTHVAYVPVGSGGTGSTSAANARSALGLSTIATLAAISSSYISSSAVGSTQIAAGAVDMTKIATDIANKGKYFQYNPATGVPQAAPGLSDASKLVSSFYTNVGTDPTDWPSFLMQDGAVRMFGASGTFSNGDPTGIHVYLPMCVVDRLGVMNGLTIAAIYNSAGSHFFLSTTGRVFAMGANSGGQLGLGDTTDRASPVEVTFFPTNSLVVAEVIVPRGGQDVTGNTLFRCTNGQLYACGNNGAGTCGNGNFTSPQTSPVRCGTLTNIVGASLSNSTNAHALAWDSGGVLYAWGRNNAGQLGDGTTTDRNSPVTCTGVGSITTKAQAVCNFDGTAYQGMSIVLRSDGTVMATGRNSSGQLGVGDTTDRSSWTLASGAPANITDIHATAGYLGTTFAKTSSGALYACGRGSGGCLGNGTTTASQTTFTACSAPLTANVSKVVGGGCRATDSATIAAIKTDGTVYVWGYNAQGQVGSGSTSTPVTSPTQLVMPIGRTADTPTDIRLVGRNGTSGVMVLTTAGLVYVAGMVPTVGPGTRAAPNAANAVYRAEQVLFL